MEHQSWSIQNHLKFRDFLVSISYITYKQIVSILIIAEILIWLLQCPYKEGLITITISSLVVIGLFLIINLTIIPVFIFIIYFSAYNNLKKMMPLTLEISANALATKIPHLGFESQLKWSAITKISHRFGIIFVEFKTVQKQNVLIPFHVFKDQEEGSRFYADLNYFWEQGR